jgi:serine/threonine-protein kinase RsbW
MIAILPRPTQQQWRTMSFASTLYLIPVLDVLLEKVPEDLHMAVRLGLQEALVNAAKHGNRLDPSKQVEVKYFVNREECCWVIADQGDGFEPPDVKGNAPCDVAAWICDDQECGRGLFILHQVFDAVEWSLCGTHLHLRLQLPKSTRRGMPHFMGFA